MAALRQQDVRRGVSARSPSQEAAATQVQRAADVDALAREDPAAIVARLRSRGWERQRNNEAAVFQSRVLGRSRRKAAVAKREQAPEQSIASAKAGEPPAADGVPPAPRTPLPAHTGSLTEAASLLGPTRSAVSSAGRRGALPLQLGELDTPAAVAHSFPTARGELRGGVAVLRVTPRPPGLGSLTGLTPSKPDTRRDGRDPRSLHRRSRAKKALSGEAVPAFISPISLQVFFAPVAQLVGRVPADAAVALPLRLRGDVALRVLRRGRPR